MGFYIRKSLKVGPLRFNLSKGGIGVSAGITGLRLGTGPRGNYVHMGRGGLYFRKSLNTKKSNSPIITPEKTPGQLIPPDENTEMIEIESGSVSEMVDSSSSELLNELNSKYKMVRYFPIVLSISIILCFVLLASDTQPWVLAVVSVIGVVSSFIAHQKDALRKSVVIFYKLDDEIEKVYESFHKSFETLLQCSSTWHIESSGKVRDIKYHAGANTLVKRNNIKPFKGSVPFLKTNIDIPVIPVGKQKIAFLPDRLLVFESNGVGAVNYNELEIEVTQTRFIEAGSVPADAKIVDHTWQYVNKKGGPDRRFKSNRQLPVAIYEDVYFKSRTGLNELIQNSKIGVGEVFLEAISNLSKLNIKPVLD